MAQLTELNPLTFPFTYSYIHKAIELLLALTDRTIPMYLSLYSIPAAGNEKRDRSSSSRHLQTSTTSNFHFICRTANSRLIAVFEMTNSFTGGFKPSTI